MTPLVQARISYAIKLVGILVAVGSVIGAAWTALNTTGIFTPVTIALFILFSLVALITALQEFIKTDPLTEIIPGDAGVQAQATATTALGELYDLLVEVKNAVTALPQTQASLTVTTPAVESGTATPSVTATAIIAPVATPPTPLPPLIPRVDPPAPDAPVGAVEVTALDGLPPGDAPGPVVGDGAGATINDTSVLIAVPQPAPDAAGDASAVSDAVPETLYRQKTDPGGHVYFVPIVV